jgi:tRNA(adenine34) deaminase
MCTSAAIWGRMKGIVYGASRKDATLRNPWRIVIPSEEVILHGTPKLELYSEFMREECKKLLLL